MIEAAVGDDGTLTYRGVVHPWHCDHMGHMNVMWYVGKFDEATWTFFAENGLTPVYLRESGRGMAAVEQKLRYIRELHAGDVVRVTTKILEAGPRKVRFVHRMYHDVTGELAATSELTGVHLDTKARRAVAFEDQVAEQFAARLAIDSAGPPKMADHAEVTIVATPQQRLGAEAACTPLLLKVYDYVVHGLSNLFLRRFPTTRLTRQYQRPWGGRHLDVGVGSAFFLDKARLPVEPPDITLLDLNRHCLETAARRIARYRPKTVLTNLFEPLPEIGTFDSVSMTYAKGVISNTEGTIEELDAAPRVRFLDVSIEQAGLVALFVARHPVPS